MTLSSKPRRIRPCSVDGCKHPHLARGWCARHYHANRNHGDPLVSIRPRGSAQERFWAKVDKTGPLTIDTSCWLWKGGISDTGYGVFNMVPEFISAHRFAYEITVGAIPEGLFLDHLCRTRACVNPDHLEPVTHAENMQRSMKLTCKRGHDLSTAYVRLDTGIRQCRECAKLRNKRYSGREGVHIPKETRRIVLKRDGFRCVYCGDANPRTIDHIISKADRRRAGIDDLDAEYMVACCLTDNIRKGTRRLVPPSWAERVDAMNEFFGGTKWRVWSGGVDEPAFKETW